MKKYTSILLITILSSIIGTFIHATEDLDTQEEYLSVAVLDFQTSDRKLAEIGKNFATLLTVNLSMEDSILLVERAELENVLSENEMSLSGAVDPSSASRIGYLTGAKVLVTGRVFEVGNKLYAVAKVMGTETSRVFGEKVKFKKDGELDYPTEQLAEKISQVLTTKKDTLVAKPIDDSKWIEEAKQKLASIDELPKVIITIPEEHLGKPIPYPAVETEMANIFKSLGYTVLDSNSDISKADIHIQGEAFSEYAMRIKNLVSCRARLEVKIVNPDTKAIEFIDSENTVAIDIGENIAAKKALAKAGKKMAKKLVEHLVE